MNISKEYPFACPYCGSENNANIDPAAGGSQRFIQDCEICCRAIHITIKEAASGGQRFQALREDEPPT